VDDGALTIQFVDPDGNAIWEETFLEDEKNVFDFTAKASGRYSLVVAGDKAEGSFDLSWDVGELQHFCRQNHRDGLLNHPDFLFIQSQVIQYRFGLIK